jgi:DNA-binding FadR family transcriptional regulator
MALPPERVLANELAVSRPTLREGLSILSQMGLVDIQPGRGGGTIVTQPPATTVSASIALLWQTRGITAGQLCEFRRALEVEAAQLAADRATPADQVAINVALRAYAAPGMSPTQQNVHGRAFHQAVARASGNPLLAETMTSLNEAFAVSFALVHAEPDSVDLILNLHQPILEAISAGDSAAARTAMIIHFDQLTDVLNELGLSPCPLAAPDAPENTSPGLPSLAARTMTIPHSTRRSPRPPRSIALGNGKGVLTTPHS